jgi:hypothetical protein
MLVVAMLVIAGCADDVTDATDPPADDVVLRVVLAGEVAADWTLADLESRVDFVSITIDGDDQTGPRLIDVLDASGVDGWESAEVFGMGEGRFVEVALDITSAQVNDGWILDVTKQGTLKLATADLPREQWVRDVGEINLP